MIVGRRIEPASPVVPDGQGAPDRLAQAAGASGSQAILETATQVLSARLRGGGWSIREENLPLANCFCALLIKLDPMVHPSLVAPILSGERGEVFDEVALVNAMAALGFRYLKVDIRPAEIDPRLLPAVLLSDRGAALYYTDNDTPVVLDGASITHEPPGDWAARTDALLFSRMAEADRPTSRAALENSGRTWFLQILRRFLPHVKYLLVIGVLLNLLALAVPLFILLIYDRVLNAGVYEPLLYLAKGVLIVLAAEYLLRRAKARLLSHVMARLDYIVGTASFEKLVELPAATLDRAEVSEQVARIKTFEAVRDFLCGPLMGTLLELPVALLSLGVILLLAGPLVWVPLTAALLILAVIWHARRRIAILIRRAAVESSRMQKFALDCFSKLDAIRLDGLTGKWLDQYREVSGREQMSQLRLALAASRAEILGQLLAGLSTLALLYVGAQLIWADRMAAASLIACLVLHMRILSPFQAMTAMVPRLEQMRNAVRQINELMSYDDEDTEARTLTTTRLDGSVRFSNVAIRYAARAPLVYSGFNLTVTAGEVIGVTGANGSGKSTLLKLILGLVEPQAGGIRLSGFDIRQLSPRDLRRQIAYVPQQVDLFSGTVAENLRLGMPLATEGEMMDALGQVGALSEVRALLHGMDTVIDPAALKTEDPLLHDRLALARALLRPSKLLLIDERPATLLRSGLDATLRECVQELRRSRTIIFVTHRTDLLRLADRVVALRGDGRAEVGTLDTILRGRE